MQAGGQIVLIGNDSDVLHSGYNHPISDAGMRYPSVSHYAHSQILQQLGLDETILLDLLCVSTRDVAEKARELLVNNMPAGHDLNSLSSYLSSSRQSYTMQGLRLRVDQDKAFERQLMETDQALLIVCDANDRELGIGMEEQAFAEWMGREHVDAQQIAYWMRNEIGRPAHLGHNQLGYFLMWLRHEVRDKKKAEMLSWTSRAIDGLSRDQNEKPVKMNVNDLIISLSGVFRPLSNYFPMRFEMKGETYRSVEHYAYEKLFLSLKLDDKLVEKITTTVLPVDVPIVAQRIFRKLEMKPDALDSKLSKLDRWRQSAMKHKVSNNEYLTQLVLSTGDALLVDNADGDPTWTCGASEAELQRLMSKDYVNVEKIVSWMRDKEKTVPKSVRHLNGNKTGLLLMELRTKLKDQSSNRIPLISPMDFSLLCSQVSPHVICLTAESVWHPLYPAEICPSPGQPLLPSPAHYVAQEAIKYLSLNRQDSQYIMEDKRSVECWQRLHQVLEARTVDIDKEHVWWMAKRQNAIREALILLLEQHPPLLKALLDTRDSLLVYCGRFSSIEAELTVGMRESDLRGWMNTNGMNTKELMDLCNRPMAFRPPYLGGNRLGFILMELRREFVLRGVFPHTLPDLNIGAEAILGSESPMENWMVGVELDVMSPDNFTASSINTFLILARKLKRPELIAEACRCKVAPRMVSLDDDRITSILDDLDNMAGKVDGSYVAECRPEDLRGVFIRLCARIRRRMVETDMQQADMNAIAREVGQMQFMRRGLEEARTSKRVVHQQMGPPMVIPEPDGPPQPLLSLPLSRRDRSPLPPMKRAVGGGDREGGRFDRHGENRGRRRSPDGRKQLRGDLIPQRRNSPRKPDRGMERRDFHEKSPPVKRQKKSPSPLPIHKEPPKVVVPKVKVVRAADEELSDGEIVDSDEE